MSETSKAIWAMILTVIALSFGDAIVRMTGAQMGVWQLFVLRSALVVPVLVAIMGVSRTSLSLGRTLMAWVILRNLLLVTTWLLYYIALVQLPMALAVASLYTLPLFILIFSALFSQDRVAPMGWVAVGLGFTSILIILRPFDRAADPYALLPLLGAMIYAASMVMTRTKCQAAPALSVALVLHLVFILIGALGSLWAWMFFATTGSGFLTGPWVALNPSMWGGLAVMGVSLLIGSIGTAYAYRNAASATIGVFDIGYLGFAVLWGILFFGEVPDIIAVIGLIGLAGAGILAVKSK